ncbi:MAG: hypothetical protein COW01_01495 [Bdellovibrionales bacterium CG12_big_fil_rev_8_21_14_0_65_38_15]|nr:MAG: hypothetical protein COW79_00045 [Bdellovibrionales bacterium CG22_combo_CG10-13_8_21_14_all_38_13]PIQ57145.1 MAG: hypothetical protein COW01_01495 [Bdellovibrionales bacterium CG12_big_fil_rev_8_21_14_0_65_38_15]PIR31516.1 MAG: hypothetical protein COV38_00065 [Bdellovibrionales bacterium CG11_big_fil_rev_8_21_14_0_20_38_13]
MNFDNFESSFTKENRKLKIALATTLIVSMLTSTMIFFQQKYFLYKGKDIFEERPLAVEVCRLGFISLAKGEPNPHVVTDEIISLVAKEPFSIQVDNILKLESLEKGACKIILKSNGELLSFKVGLKESDFYPFHYKLIQLDEINAQEEI